MVNCHQSRKQTNSMSAHRIATPLFCLLTIAMWVRLPAAEKREARVTASDLLRIPAFTAYAEPDAEAVDFSEASGVTGWKSAKDRIVWYGELKTAGDLEIALTLRLPAVSSSRLKLTVAKKTFIAVANGMAGTEPVTVSFGTVAIPKPGYYAFTLTGLSKIGTSFGDLQTLLLSGSAVQNAHFNLKERRNAASVHLGYPTDKVVVKGSEAQDGTKKDAKIVWFYNEVTVKTDPVWSYYMACGFSRGYFGIQVNSPTERRVIFSVWDSGSEAVDRSKVDADDRVQLLGKGVDVVADSFGNEGTGGHSHLVYNWKKGATYRFLLSAQPDGTHTTYSGYFYFPEKQKWELIARFRAPKDGRYLSGLYSFNENFGGANGEKRRLAQFGNQWIKTADGVWTELTTARFTHDGTGKEDRLDYNAGVVQGRFFLSNGGFVGGPIKYGATIERPATHKPPTDIVLP